MTNVCTYVHNLYVGITAYIAYSLQKTIVTIPINALTPPKFIEIEYIHFWICEENWKHICFEYIGKHVILFNKFNFRFQIPQMACEDW